MGGGAWSDAFYREADLREPSPIERERVHRSWQGATTPPSSRTQNVAEQPKPPETPTIIRLSRYKRRWVI